MSDYFKKCFFMKSNSYPFTEGEGLIKVLEKLGYKAILDTSNKKVKIICLDLDFVSFKKNDFPFIQIRPDNIRKKYKVTFHQNLLKLTPGKKENKLNNKSKRHTSFKLPQNFITNVNVLENSLVMDLTYEELLSNIKNVNINNLCMDLDEDSNWNEIKNMTYKELLEAFSSSAEFERSIMDLKIKSEKKNKKISALYIETYINLALTYTDFYSSIPIRKTKKVSPTIDSTSTPSNNTNITKNENDFSSTNRGNPFPFSINLNNPIFLQNDTSLLNEENYSLNESDDSINMFHEEQERQFIINFLEQKDKIYL